MSKLIDFKTHAKSDGSILFPKLFGDSMNFKLSTLLSLFLFFSLQTYSMPDLLRLDEERIIYWQEKKLGRTLSEYEKRQLINGYIQNSGKRKVSALQAPLAVSRKQSKHSVKYSQSNVVDTLRSVKILTILVDFPDLRSSSPGLEPEDTDMFYNNYSAEHYSDLLFSTTGYTGPSEQTLKSARQFYREVTGNNFDLTGQVYGWVTAKNNAAYYGKRNGDERDVNVTALIKEAVESLVAQGVDLSDFDLTDLNDIDGDGIINEPDGVIDHILIFHSSIGEEAGGGALGENAIWSHRFFVTENNQPASIQGSNIKAYNYTINPIDAGIGVVVHEFGHDLGLPDEYDLKDINIGEPVANWSVMSSGSWMGELRGSAPGMFSPKNLDFLQTRFGGNWTNQVNIDLNDLSNTNTYNLTHAGVHSDAIKQLKIQLPPNLEDFIKPNSGSLQYYSGEGNNLNNQMSFSIELPESKSVILKMLSQFSIESDYDVFQVFVNSQAIAGNATKATHPNYPNVKHYLDGNSFAGDKASGEFVELSYDLTAFNNQEVTITFVYQSDEAISYFGIVLDDIRVLADNSVVYIDDVDSNETTKLNGFRKIGRYKSGAEHAYYVQLRSHQGVDQGLKLAQYAAGLTLWYSNENYDDNNTSEHQGFGDLLVIDTDQRPIYRSNNTSLAESSIQVRDAALRLTDQSAGLGDSDLSPIMSFNDSKDYSFEVQPESGVNIPLYGLSISLLDLSASFDTAEIQVSYDMNTRLTYKVDDKKVKFRVNGFVLEETDTFTWTFSDGQQSTELNPEIQFEQYQNYSATFTQTKQDGQTRSETITLNLTKPVEISAFNVSHANGVLTGSVEVSAGLAPYEITWDLGDGSTLVGENITHKYTKNGTYVIIVSVKDSNADVITQSKQFTITVPLEVTTSLSSNQLSLNASANVSGGSGNYDISWEFGDGNTATGRNTTHAYTATGTYSVTVTVTDLDTNKVETVTKTINISQQQQSGSGSSGSLFFVLFASIFIIRRLQ